MLKNDENSEAFSYEGGDKCEITMDIRWNQYLQGLQRMKSRIEYIQLIKPLLNIKIL